MLHLTLEDELFLGTPKQVGTHSTVYDHLAVMFEDDGQTGYFYALDMRQNEQPIADMLHVYNVDSASNHHEARKLEICWDTSGYLALLLINGYPHAVFDFARLVGYNGNKYPQPDLMSMWTHEEITNDKASQWLNVPTIK
ncbi:Uncharacterized protein conserved in bacteria [Stutzerimonas stutzeri]|nr:Uncharacterized protein conserved in bacteria [Stutzerimonas stutzeri]